MKVLHVIPAVAPRYGGPSAAIVGLCRALEAAGVSTTIAATDADGAGRLPVPIGEACDFEGIPSVFFRRRLGEAFKWSAGMSAWLRSHVHEFDLVHVHAVFSHSSLAAGQACRLAGVPYVVRPLGTLDPWSLSRKRRRKRWLLQLGGLNLLTGAAAMHYTSQEEMRLAEAAIPGLPPGVVSPLGIDDACFEPAGSNPGGVGGPYVLCLARLDMKKGIDLLIRAFHRVATDPVVEGWKLVIAGDGRPTYVSMLEQLAENGAAASRIQFRGWVTGAEKCSLLQGAGVFVLSSHQENFGISVGEAMASGVPVIVSPGVNLASEIESEGAGWVVARDETAIAAALVHAIGDVEDRRARGRSARRLAGRLRWPGVAERLAAVYRGICERAGRPVVL